jgi:hypothetical protein
MDSLLKFLDALFKIYQEDYFCQKNIYQED